MAVLDILTLRLIEFDLEIRNLATSVGRIFHARLQSILGRPGLLHLYWGGHCEVRGLVGLILVWEDEATRDVFKYSEQDFWSFNKYLEVPMSLRIIRNVDLNQLRDLNDKFLLIRTRVEGTEDDQSDVAWIQCKQAFLADTDVTSLQGSLWRLEADDELPRRLRRLDGSKKDLRIIQLADAMVGVVPDEAYCRKVTNLSSITNDEMIQLKEVTPNLPVALHEVITATRISHVFVRDPRLLRVSAQPSSGVEDVEPLGEWRPPSIAYWIGDERCFDYTGSLVNAKPRTPESLPLGTHRDSYFETLTFVFKDDFQDQNIAAAPILDTFRAYRRCSFLQPGNKAVYLIIHPSKPRLFTLFIKWACHSDSASFHASQLAKDSLSELKSYLATTELPTPSIGIAFNPIDCNNAEVIDFTLAPSTTSAEKRAFLLFLEDMLEGAKVVKIRIMGRSPETCIGARDPLSVDDQGWVDTTDPAHSLERNEASDETVSGPNYRILVLWDGQAEEAEWVRKFVRSLGLYGIPPHMIAQCVDRVIAKQVRIMREG